MHPSLEMFEVLREASPPATPLPIQWLAGLQIINQRDDILLSYQREYDEDWQRVQSNAQ